MESSRRRVPWPVLSGLGLVAFVVTTRTIFTTDETLSVAQSRAEILGLASAALLILLEVAKSSDVKVRATEQVELVGVETDRCETGWEAVAKAAGLVLGVANIQTVIVWRRGSGILVEKGRIRDNLSHGFDLGRTVVDKVLTSGERAYLADLRVAPARVEFRYLPENVQVSLQTWPSENETNLLRQMG